MIRDVAAPAFVLLSFVLSALLATPVDAQSFDCKKARTATEKAICAAPDLGYLDSAMAVAYGAAHAKMNHAGREELLAGQRSWLKVRDSCGGKGDCLSNAYLKRLSALGKAAKIFPGWAGHYENWSGIDITIKAKGDGRYAVQLSGAGQDYTCESNGVGRAAQEGRLDVRAGEAEVVLTEVGSGFTLPENLQQPSDFASCGARAPGVGGYYARRR